MNNNEDSVYLHSLPQANKSIESVDKLYRLIEKMKAKGYKRVEYLRGTYDPEGNLSDSYLRFTKSIDTGNKKDDSIPPTEAINIFN